MGIWFGHGESALLITANGLYSNCNLDYKFAFDSPRDDRMIDRVTAADQGSDCDSGRRGDRKILERAMSPRSNALPMAGKNVLITGANSGLGFASARALAERGARVIMVCRNETRGMRARDEVAKGASGDSPVLLIADLSSQRAIRNLAEEVHARFDRLDVLMNNAAAIFSRRELTGEGIEKTF